MLVISVPSKGYGINLSTSSGKHLATLGVRTDLVMYPIVHAPNSPPYIEVVSSPDSKENLIELSDVGGSTLKVSVTVAHQKRNNLSGYKLCINAPRDIIVTKIVHQ